MTSLAERVVGVASRRLDRRGFLGRSAVIGSALVVAPAELALRPTSAYAAVCRCRGSDCGCGSLCCDGYTEFCCTSTGANACPDGTITGGWWKVDGSAYCGGSARYYLDCNSQCGPCGCGPNGVCSGACSGTPCGCDGGRCDRRKSGCTQFRYGQCHQETPCIGPIVCRVVTCTPPWLFDPACGTSSRTDERTRNHHRPCALEPFGAIDDCVDAGGSIRVVGWAVDNRDAGTSLVRIYVDGQVWADVDANVERPDVGAAWPAFGSKRGFDVVQVAPPGLHVVCAYAIDRTTGIGRFVGFRLVTVAPPTGSIDTAVGGVGIITVAGWAADPGRWAAPAVVRVSVDGAAVIETGTSVARPDVSAAGVTGTSPTPGFRVEVAAAAGPHEVCVDVVGWTGSTTRLGCALVVVS